MLMIDVEQRVANWTALPPDHLEGWQVCTTILLGVARSLAKCRAILFDAKSAVWRRGAPHRSQQCQAASGCASGSISCTSGTAAAATTHSSSGLP